VATDHSRMLVLLKIDPDQPAAGAESLAVPEFVPKDQMRVGQWAIAVGRTFEGNRPNMSVGILSALGRICGKAIQTDAAVSPNNYGGPLVDVRGRVLGVLVPLAPGSAQETAGYQWYDSGIGFAIDAEHILKVLPRLTKGEDVYPGVIGIRLQGMVPAGPAAQAQPAARAIGEPVIAACRSDGPAAQAGLKPGDRIVEIDGRQIVRAAEAVEELSRRYAGEKVHLVVLRGQKRLEFDVEMVARKRGIGG
jgi:serine protease Do